MAGKTNRSVGLLVIEAYAFILTGTSMTSCPALCLLFLYMHHEDRLKDRAISDPAVYMYIVTLELRPIILFLHLYGVDTRSKSIYVYYMCTVRTLDLHQNMYTM